MTDVRKVVSSLNTPTMTATNRCKTPEGDRPVRLDRNGFLNLDYPLVLSPVRYILDIDDEAEAKASSNGHILSGAFYSANRTLTPSDLDPRRIMIRSSGGAGILTFPVPGGAGGLVTYLKNTYGANNITAGLYWKIIFMNDFNGQMTLRVETPGAGLGTIQTYGFGTAVTPFDVELDAKTTAERVQTVCVTIHILLESVAPAAEKIVYWAEF